MVVDPTPVMRQYQALKRRHPDTLLLFRMGDFYELFYEDAEVASRVLGLTLTSREKHRDGGVPMAGVPWHAVEGYVARLIRAGYRVALADQTEDARYAKGLVGRDIVEVITPGTVTSDSLLAARENNYLAAMAPGRAAWGLAVADVSTGEFYAGEVAGERISEELSRLQPREVLSPRSLDPAELPALGEGVLVTACEDASFFHDSARRLLLDHFHTASLAGYGIEELPEAVRAAGALLQYLRELKRSDLPHLARLSRLRSGEVMDLDEATLFTLDVFPRREGALENSLLGVLDRTETAPGSRRLRRALRRPLLSADAIRERQEGVAELAADRTLAERIGAGLAGMHDLERLTSRASAGRASPRDLAAIRDSLARLPSLREALAPVQAPRLTALANEISIHEGLHDLLARALVDSPPPSAGDGGLVRDGYDAGLDDLRRSSREGKVWIAGLEARERARTGITSLRVGFNKVFGYYIEVTRAHQKLVPPDFDRKQTLVNAERYVTPELKEVESRVLGAEERAASREKEIFGELCLQVVAESAALLTTAGALAEIDFLRALAEAASRGGYVRPEVDESTEIEIEEGRHPVVEKTLAAGEFVPNDTLLGAPGRKIAVVTGPNMAGKSTYLRQVGLIALMAQIGSFVPAARARIGIVDRIFTRVGAADDIARGQSTFLVEMNETSSILHNATARSLLLLDEIGRGTSTYDGLSIAWAVAEHLHDAPGLAPRTLFATHYHELTELANRHEHVHNLNVMVREWNDEVIFLRRVTDGTADRSYGIQVARLAGLPASVLARAREILEELEAGRFVEREARRPPGAQLALFAAGVGEKLLEELRGLEPDRMTPLEALAKLGEWRRRYGGG